MRKIIFNLAVTLDGLIEGPNGEYDWCFTDQDYGMTEFLTHIDAILFGRKSYEVLISSEPNAFEDKQKVVFSNTLKIPPQGVKLISGEIIPWVESFKKEEGLDIWLFGGAQLFSNLMNAGLVDELQLAVHPILLGKGKLLFQNIDKQKTLRLKNMVQYSSGLIQLFYDIN